MKHFRVLLAVLVNGAALASVINVPAAQPTIQAGINAANNSDTVLVAPGTYTENINFMGKAITVKSAKGSSVTILDGGGLAPVVTFNTNETSSSTLSDSHDLRLMPLLSVSNPVASYDLHRISQTD